MGKKHPPPDPRKGFATTVPTLLDSLPANLPATLPQGTTPAPPDRNSLPIFLFDLNGTLTSHTAQRHSSGKTLVRPGIKAFASLAHKCRVGIFSSATHRTVAEARQLIEEAMGGQAFFEPGLILHRDHTVSTPHAAGKAWDTAKPLSKWFSSLERVLLFDDDEHKSLADERGNLVLVPDWQEEDEGCKVLEEMANVLEEVLDRLQPGEDIRPHVTTITSRLKAVAEERAKEKGQTTASAPQSHINSGKTAANTATVSAPAAATGGGPIITALDVLASDSPSAAATTAPTHNPSASHTSPGVNPPKKMKKKKLRALLALQAAAAGTAPVDPAAAEPATAAVAAQPATAPLPATSTNTEVPKQRLWPNGQPMSKRSQRKEKRRAAVAAKLNAAIAAVVDGEQPANAAAPKMTKEKTGHKKTALAAAMAHVDIVQLQERQQQRQQQQSGTTTQHTAKAPYLMGNTTAAAVVAGQSKHALPVSRQPTTRDDASGVGKGQAKIDQLRVRAGKKIGGSGAQRAVDNKRSGTAGVARTATAASPAKRRATAHGTRTASVKSQRATASPVQSRKRARVATSSAATVRTTTTTVTPDKPGKRTPNTHPSKKQRQTDGPPKKPARQQAASKPVKPQPKRQAGVKRSVGGEGKSKQRAGVKV